MKYLFFLFLSSFAVSFDVDNYLRVDIIESVNLKCKDHNEFHCNPYAILHLKLQNEKQTTSTIQCTKNPQWLSSFTFHPSFCHDILYVNLFQYFTQSDKEFFGASPDSDSFSKGFLSTGYLGRVVINLDKLPRGTFDEWFMVDNVEDDGYVHFPSCVHLRISYVSEVCRVNENNVYDIEGKEFSPRKFIQMCNRDFVSVYKNRFSDVNSTNGIEEKDYVDKGKCHIEEDVDYAFRHITRLTAIEEALAMKIVMMSTGEKINLNMLTKAKRNFVNGILRNHAMNRTENEVYNRTLEQFKSIEEIKHIDDMDDDSYLRTMNKISDVIRDIKIENKTQRSKFIKENKVMLNSKGMIDAKEELFFRIFCLYKYTGGQLKYDALKKEFILRRKFFKCYEEVNIMPSNIIFQFIDDKCPDNYVCIDPNGVIVDSEGKNPKKVFGNEIEYFNSSNEDNEVKTFNKMINEDIVNEDKGYMNKFDILYNQRHERIKKKKDIIINLIHDNYPLLGEILSLAKQNVTNSSFISNEKELLIKYIQIINNKDHLFLPQSASLLFTLITSKSFSHLINEFIEGLCIGDSRSIKIFTEIIRTVILNRLLKQSYLDYDDIMGKITLLNVFNSNYCFSPITKIQFIEDMLLLPEIKKKIIDIIWENDSNAKISTQIKEIEASMGMRIKERNESSSIRFKELKSLKYNQIMNKLNP